MFKTYPPTMAPIPDGAIRLKIEEFLRRVDELPEGHGLLATLTQVSTSSYVTKTSLNLKTLPPQYTHIAWIARRAKMRPIEADEGDLMTLDAFQHSIERGYFIDYDGVGVPATETHVCTGALHDVYPSSFNLEKIKAAGFTHIMWYNR